MKKVLFLLLFLVGLGVANLNSQVRIGGDGEPHTAAVLDLNTDDTDDGNKGALALPRVSLATNTDELNGATPLTGMLVYNTNASMIDGSGIGVYFYDGSYWVKIRVDGTIASMDLADNAVTTSKIEGGAVSLSKLKYTVGQILVTISGTTAGSAGNGTLPVGCNLNNTFISITGVNMTNCYWLSTNTMSCVRLLAGSAHPSIQYFCLLS